MDYRQHKITLPMPPSTNARLSVGPQAGKYHKSGKQKIVFRSPEYKAWIEHAAIHYRNQCPGGTQLLEGRLRAQYVFFFNSARDQDVANREKCLSDFLEHKIFKNDAQIDENFSYRKIRPGIEQHVVCFLTEIPDMRYEEGFAP